MEQSNNIPVITIIFVYFDGDSKSFAYNLKLDLLALILIYTLKLIATKKLL